MSRLVALMENSEVQNILAENTAILEQAQKDFDTWYGILVDFVTENIEEFLGENIEETKKNIYTFATFSTSQYLTEMAHVYGDLIQESVYIKEAKQHEFV